MHCNSAVLECSAVVRRAARCRICASEVRACVCVCVPFVQSRAEDQACDIPTFPCCDRGKEQEVPLQSAYVAKDD
jgi:hypothetical protein